MSTVKWSAFAACVAAGVVFACGSACADEVKASGKEKVVIFSAHLDDMSACAGFALLTKDVFDFHVVDFTCCPHPNDARDGLPAGETRRREEAKACAMINATPHYIDEPDGGLYATREVVEKVKKYLTDLKPRAIILHWPLDCHHDHVMSAAAVLKAVRELDLTFDEDFELYFMEEPYQARNFTPHYMVDFSRVADERDRLIRCYVTQAFDGPMRLAAAARGCQSRKKHDKVECYATMGGIPGGNRRRCIFNEIPGSDK